MNYNPDDSINPDLNDQPCSVGMCFKVADVVGKAEVVIDPLVGAIPEEAEMTLELPLCMNHSHLLRMGVVSCDLTTL